MVADVPALALQAYAADVDCTSLDIAGFLSRYPRHAEELSALHKSVVEKFAQSSVSFVLLVSVNGRSVDLAIKTLK